eukprot:3937397-Rhodomonas_salina.1
MTLALFDSAAELVFIDQVAALLGKERSDVRVTNKQEVVLRRRLLSAGVQVDYEVGGFADAAAVTAAGSAIESKAEELVTTLQSDAKFSALTGIDMQIKP